ncbi:hypothetical protein JOC62_003020 [Clostridium sardiniense]|nr:hypothetical protein [Clostridium sardiniense]
MNTANLFDSVYYADDEPQLISNLSWTGHNYIDNIRDDKIWSKTKAATSKIHQLNLQLLC